jgi:hypothetical protein
VSVDGGGQGEREAIARSEDISDEELAAAIAAVELAWPRAVVADSAAAPPRWRFAGRWWSKPVPARRERPW